MITNITQYDELNKLSDYKITNNSFNKVIAYCDNDVIIGYLDYSVMYERAEINYIFIKNEYRHKGIASKLINYMLQVIDVDSITLEVRIDNYSALALYKKFNFKEVSIRKNYYDDVDGILMIRSR